MSVVLRVVFLRRGFILAVSKDAGTMPEVREELIIEVRNGRISLETSWAVFQYPYFHEYT